MTGDEIILTIPGEQPFREVAHLVLGGVAARLDLTFEGLDDLETALEAVLEQSPADGEVTVRLRVDQGSINAVVGPFAVEPLRAELERDPGEAVTLRRILDTVVDRYELDQDGWLELSKRVEPEGDSR